MLLNAPPAPSGVYDAAVPDNLTNEISRQVVAPNTAWSKRGVRVGSWLRHHVSIADASSCIADASVAKLSAVSDGSATIAWICWPVTASGKSVAVSPVPHH